ncbi:MAG: hypothetical protein UW83_C0020G0013, partial [Parcubacteria group bacterium GW2011_GWD1_44_9]
QDDASTVSVIMEAKQDINITSGVQKRVASYNSLFFVRRVVKLNGFSIL